MTEKLISEKPQKPLLPEKPSKPLLPNEPKKPLLPNPKPDKPLIKGRMKTSLSVNDQVKMYPDGDTLYFITGTNANNIKLVNVCKISDNQIINNVVIDQLTMDKLYLLRKISAIHAIKCAKAISFEIALQSLEKLSSMKAEFAGSSTSKLLEVNSFVIEWQGSIPIVSDIELNDFLKQNH